MLSWTQWWVYLLVSGAFVHDVVKAHIYIVICKKNNFHKNECNTYYPAKHVQQPPLHLHYFLFPLKVNNNKKSQLCSFLWDETNLLFLHIHGSIYLTFWLIDIVRREPCCRCWWWWCALHYYFSTLINGWNLF